MVAKAAKAASEPGGDAAHEKRGAGNVRAFLFSVGNLPDARTTMGM